MHNF
jgi:hypothetical protein